MRSDGSKDESHSAHNAGGKLIVSDKNFLLELSQIDLTNVIADVEDIRKLNPQRFEMEQLTAIVYEDIERHICVGYKDVSSDEFWIRGHMPGMPLMPGVIMCEAAAQLASYYVQKNDLLKAKVVGFGGLEDVRFRGIVVPGDKLILMLKLTKIRARRMLVCKFQGIVHDSVVVEGVLKGIPLPVDDLTTASTN